MTQDVDGRRLECLYKRLVGTRTITAVARKRVELPEVSSVDDAPMKSCVLDLLRLARQQERALLADLSDVERAATGILDRWSARDTIAHIAAWRQRHAEKLGTAVSGATPPVWTDTHVIDHVNAETYAEYQRRSWQEVQGFAERASAALIDQVERLSELDLVDTQRFPILHGEALWPETLGNGVWHPLSHLAALARERGDTERAAQIQDTQIRGHEVVLRAMDHIGAAPRFRAESVYNLACHYALAGQPARALDRLREAVALRPDLALHAKHDADFASLHSESGFQALAASARDADLIDLTALREQLSAEPPPLAIDVRDPDEYSVGHVAGAINVPLGTLPDRINTLPVGRRLVTYCNMSHRGASRGERAAALLRDYGFAAAALDGGYPGWKDAGLPIEAGPQG